MKGERLALWWVDRYTRGLDAEVRHERRAELESDLWEHRAEGDDLSAAIAIASRCLRGVPADLSWRRSVTRGRRTLPSRSSLLRGTGWALAGMAYALLILIHGWFATALLGLGLYGDDWAPGDVAHWSRIAGLLLVMLVLGAAVIRRAPRAAALLVSAAAVTTACLMWWFLPVMGPVALAVTAGSTVLARRRQRTLQARASSATS